MNIPKPHPLPWAFQAGVPPGTIKNVSKEKKGSIQLKAVMFYVSLKNHLCVLLGFFFCLIKARDILLGIICMCGGDPVHSRARPWTLLPQQQATLVTFLWEASGEAGA